jgi:hypothetical protein
MKREREVGERNGRSCSRSGRRLSNNVRYAKKRKIKFRLLLKKIVELVKEQKVKKKPKGKSFQTKKEFAYNLKDQTYDKINISPISAQKHIF